MQSSNSDPEQAAVDLRVPETLLNQLHDANARLHAARKQMELAMDAAEMPHQERVDQAGTEVSAAERALEEISLKIHNALQPAPPRESRTDD